MFWKKQTKDEIKPAVKKPVDILSEQVQQATLEKPLYFEMFAGTSDLVAVVELNPAYPDKGGKYFLSIDKIVNGKPQGTKNRIKDTDKPRVIGDWLDGKNSRLLNI